ncbi:MAG: Myo-inositol 2-dehydrogenase [bacterium]|nr:Myo-inositol 2-dehydrogenase [bacterium]
MINAALLGCGEMGRLHADCIAQLSGIRIYACCDTNESRALAFREKYNAAVATTEPQRIWQDENIQLVYVATPTNSHKALCLAGIAAGKHLMIEKPIALTASEAHEIYTAAKRAGLIAMVGLKFRFYEMVQKARELVPSPFLISVQVMDDPWPPDFWANDPEQGGGNVISQGIHGADLLRFFADADPECVFAVGANYHQPTGVVDNLSATFRFENGVAGSLIVGDCGQPPQVSKFMAQLHGPAGSVLVTERLTHLQFKPRGSTEISTYRGEENGILEENRALLKALRGEAPVAATLWKGYVAQAMIEAGIRSAQSRQAERVLTELHPA